MDQRILRALEQHDVQWRVVGGRYEALDEYTDHEEWIACPATLEACMDWLGY